jgi:hypothetical protein
VLNVVATYRHLAPTAFAARERLATNPAHHAVARHDPTRGAPQPGMVRRWLGDRLVRLGTWLGGADVPSRGRILAAQILGPE